MLVRGPTVAFALMLASSVATAGPAVSGRAKLESLAYNAGSHTLESELGYKTSHEWLGQFRLVLDQQAYGFALQAAWQLDVHHGSTVRRNRLLDAIDPALVSSMSSIDYWDLGSTFSRGGGTLGEQRLDRLNVSWTGDQLVLRLGRQALTWGSGLVFHPMDLVNPFQPVATDTAFKRGTDMAYVQWLFDDGSDLQLVGVPRRRRDSLDPTAGKNTWAAFANMVGDATQWSFLLARHRTDDVLGVGMSHPWGGAVWNGELISTSTPGYGARISFLTNVSYAGVLRGHNFSLFAEYFHNGVGKSGRDYAVSQLDTDLLWRVNRGESFVTGRDYLAIGANWNWTPLLQIVPTVIVNLRDRSLLLDGQLDYSLSDNIAFKAGLRLPIGARGSELRGLEIAPGWGVYLASSARAFARIEVWF